MGNVGFKFFEEGTSGLQICKELKRVFQIPVGNIRGT